MLKLVVLALVGLAARLVGALAGATLLVHLSADLAEPLIAAILLTLGFYVTWRFLTLRTPRLSPRRAVGSVDTDELVVTVGTSVGFLVALGSQAISWSYVAALLVGGFVVAPIAAALVRFMPPRVLGVAVGGVIVLTNLKTLAEVVGVPGITIALLASTVFTLWVLWVAYAVKLEEADREGGGIAPQDRVRAHVTA